MQLAGFHRGSTVLQMQQKADGLRREQAQHQDQRHAARQGPGQQSHKRGPHDGMPPTALNQQCKKPLVSAKILGLALVLLGYPGG